MISLNNTINIIKKYSLNSLILFIVFIYYIRSNFLKLTLFLPIFATLVFCLIFEITTSIYGMILMCMVTYFLMTINYKNNICKEEKVRKQSSFRTSIVALIPYVLIIPLMVLVLKIYPRKEFVNIFGETYGVLAYRMRITSDDSMFENQSIIKQNNGMFIWILLTTMYMTHVSEMILMLENC